MPEPAFGYKVLFSESGRKGYIYLMFIRMVFLASGWRRHYRIRKHTGTKAGFECSGLSFPLYIPLFDCWHPGWGSVEITVWQKTLGGMFNNEGKGKALGCFI